MILVDSILFLCGKKTSCWSIEKKNLPDFISQYYFNDI